MRSTDGEALKEVESITTPRYWTTCDGTRLDIWGLTTIPNSWQSWRTVWRSSRRDSREDDWTSQSSRYRLIRIPIEWSIAETGAMTLVKTCGAVERPKHSALNWKTVSLNKKRRKWLEAEEPALEGTLPSDRWRPSSPPDAPPGAQTERSPSGRETRPKSEGDGRGRWPDAMTSRLSTLWTDGWRSLEKWVEQAPQHPWQLSPRWPPPEQPPWWRWGCKKALGWEQWKRRSAEEGQTIAQPQHLYNPRLRTPSLQACQWRDRQPPERVRKGDGSHLRKPEGPEEGAPPSPHPSEALTTTRTRGGRGALPVRPATRKGSASRGTPEGQPATWHWVEKPQVYQDQLKKHTKEAQQELTTPVAGIGKRRYSTAATERNSHKANTTGATREGGLQRWPPRLDTRGERERENGQAELANTAIWTRQRESQE